MALKAILETLDGIPEALHAYYTPQDGKFVLDAEVDAHPSVTGLKNSLVHAREERRIAKELAAKYTGMDPAKYTEMLAHEQQIQEGKLIAEGKMEELLELRTRALRESLAAETLKERTEKVSLQTQLDKLVIDNAVQTAAAKHGVKKSAVEDVLFRARAVFKAQNGAAVAFQGENPVYAKDGVTLLGIDEWMSTLPAVASHLFEESKGTSAPGGSPKPVAGPGSITRNDPAAFLANLDAISKGKVRVV